MEFVNNLARIFIDWQLHIFTSRLLAGRLLVSIFDCLLFYVFVLPSLHKSVNGNLTAVACVIGLAALIVLSLVNS